MINVINYHLTSNCNYRCVYCFGKFKKGVPTFEQACKIVDSVNDYFKKNHIVDGRINLAGGEPLSCTYLDDLIDYICECGIKVSVITNGSMLTEEKIKSWAGKVEMIGLSVDSLKPETNRMIGRRCNEKTISIEQLAQLAQAIHRADILLKINIVVSKLNMQEDFTELYKQLKPDRFKFLQMERVKKINDKAQKYAIDKQEYSDFCNRHKECKIVSESSDMMENSYPMIDPKGRVLLNDRGKYKRYGNCIKKKFNQIIKRIPLDQGKFDKRYENKKAC